MIARGQGGTIINMASMNALIISNLFPRHNVPYCVAKAGVAQLTKGMASDWAQHNIRVNAIAPGYMKTPMTAPTRQYPEIVDRLLANTPMKRYGEEEDQRGGGLPGVAGLVLHDRQRGGHRRGHDDLVSSTASLGRD